MKLSRTLGALVCVLPIALTTVACGGIAELEPGDQYDTRFRRNSLETIELQSEFALTESVLAGTMAMAKPDNCLDGMGAPFPCYEFQAFGCRWEPVYVDVPDTATVTATGTRDYMLICQSPDGNLFGADDFDVVECVTNGACDPALNLIGAGRWLCLVTVSPYDTDFYTPNDPVGGELTINVN